MRTSVIHLSLIVVTTAVVFANTLPNDFHFDDIYLVRDNPGIRDVSPIWRHFTDPRTSSSLPRLTQYRPLLPLTLSISYYFRGNDPAGYHIGNLLGHMVASVLVYFLCLELLAHWAGSEPQARRRRGLALVVALIFAVHPVSGFPINYISARDLILMNLFLVASLLAYVRMRRLGANVWRWIAGLGLLLLSLFSKTNAVVAPALIFLFEITVGGQRLRDLKPWLMASPFAGVVALHMVFKRWALGFSDFTNAVAPIGNFWDYPLLQAKVHLVEYLRNFVWPFRIRLTPWVEPAAGRPDAAMAVGLAIIAGALVVAWQLRRSRPVLSFCIGAYFVLLIPTSVLPLFYNVAHYRPYPSSPFLFLAVALGLGHLLKGRWAAVTSAVLVVYLSVASVLVNRTFLTEESAWLQSVRYGGEPVAHLNYARSIPDRSDPRVRQHMEEALRLSPDYVVGIINLGFLHLDLGEPSEGIALVERAVGLAPQWAQSHYWLSSAYSTVGRDRDALAPAMEAARLDPRNIDYQYHAAVLLQAAGDYERSLEYLERVESREPMHQHTLLLKGLALQKGQRLDEAIATYRRLLQERETDDQAHFNLAHALMTSGRPREAIPHFKRVLELNPRYAEVFLHLGSCYEGLGMHEDAARARQSYADAQPDSGS